MNENKDLKLVREEKIPLDSAIYLENISFGYTNDLLNLKNINLDIKQGESVAIIGHNGSGKSTLSKLIDGILIQNEGEIYIFGVKMTDDNALKLRKDIGLVFQNPDSQFVGATVRDDIAFGLENDCVDPKDMDDIILKASQKVGMEEYLDFSPEQLSGGQKQRVAIADSISRKPRILILDEAGAMLDPKGRRKIREIIAERKREDPNLTLITITHEIDEAYDASRVIVLNKGEIILDDSPEKVFSNAELLKKVHLDIPFAHQLAEQLKKLGMDIPDIKNDKELLNYLCQ